VSGYFQSRQDLWKEPIYRDLWGILLKFGDAEIAGMIAPRALIVEACSVPHVEAVTASQETRSNSACPNSKLATPALDDVQREVERARPVFADFNASSQLQLVVSNEVQHRQICSESVLGYLDIRPYSSFNSQRIHRVDRRGTLGRNDSGNGGGYR
jgi:hypothetical protein